MKRYFIILLFSLSLIVIYLGYYLKPYYTPAKKQYGLSVKRHLDDTVRIAYIGDSWAEGHKMVICRMDSLIYQATGKPAIVKTAGISGLTSKNVYYSIFRNDSIRNVIEWGPDFCFVVAGINDSDRKMGKDYYIENMRLIIDLLLEHHIKPIILEIPSYDIHFSFKRRSRQVKLQYLMSMLVTWSKMNCIEDYRLAYHHMIRELGWGEEVITIYIKDWNPDGYKDVRGLYDGGLMHLNARGYWVLDSCIASKIVNIINSSNNDRFH